MLKVHNGDCLEVMQSLPDHSVDMILCDLPYGTTRNAWDSVIPLPELWDAYRRICRGAIVLTAQSPFDKVLGASNLAMLRYEWIWEKTKATGHLSANKQPLKNHENVLVFSEDLAAKRGAASEYEPLRRYLQAERTRTGLSAKQIDKLLGNSMASHYFTNGVQFCIPSEANYRKLQSTGHFLRPYEEIKADYDALGATIESVLYNPQGLIRKDTPTVRKGCGNGSNYGKSDRDAVQEFENYPRSILRIPSESRPVHPTQKPVALMEYLIRTYTNDGDVVMDNCMGSGTTGVACINTGRGFIGIERDPDYFKIAENRIVTAFDEWTQRA